MADLQDILSSGNITLVDSDGVIVSNNIQYLQADTDEAKGMFMRIGDNGLTTLYKAPNEDATWSGSDDQDRALTTTEQQVLSVSPTQQVTVDDGSYNVLCQLDNNNNQDVEVSCLFYIDGVLGKTSLIKLAKSETGKAVIFSSGLNTTIGATATCDVRFLSSQSGVNLRGDLLNTSIELVKANANPILSLSSVDGLIQFKRGFDRLNPDLMGVPSYDESTRTFALSIKNGFNYFHLLSGGTYYKYETDKSIVWPNITGTYYFYFDSIGDLKYILDSDLTEAIFVTSAICGLVYWNATTQKAIVQAIDEQHGVIMDSSSHLRLHLGDGAKIIHGGDITGLADNSSTYTGIASLLSADEDINIPTGESTGHPFIYRSGANGDWVETATPDNNIAYMGSTYAYWNEYTGSTWQLTEGGSSTDYIIYYFLWTNDANNPIKKIVGQHAYASRRDARDALESEVGKLKLGGFPSTEAYLMYAYIAVRTGVLEDDGEGNTYVDLRGKHPFNA